MMLFIRRSVKRVGIAVSVSCFVTFNPNPNPVTLTLTLTLTLTPQISGTSYDVNSYDQQAPSSSSRAICFTLGKEQKNKTGTKGLNGKLLPWHDPKKKIKRKPLVESSPYMMPKRRTVAA